MIEAAAIAFIVAKIKGLKIRPLFRSWPFYPFAAMCAAALPVYILLAADYRPVLAYVKAFKLLFFLSLIFFIYMHRKALSLREVAIGCVFSAFGVLLNNIVINANGGKMPVFFSLSRFIGSDHSKLLQFKDMYVAGGETTRFKLLSDMIDLGYENYSIGDIFMGVLPALIVYQVIRHLNHTPQ